MDADQSTAPAASAEQESGAAEELAYRLRQQQLTAEFGLFALRTHDIGALLQEATQVCAQGLQSGFCKIMEYLPAEHQFVVQAGVGWKPGVVGSARVGADIESPTGYAFQTGEPVISNHLQGESRFRTPKLLEEHGIKRAINVVIRSEGKSFGALEVDSPTEGRFTGACLRLREGERSGWRLLRARDREVGPQFSVDADRRIVLDAHSDGRADAGEAERSRGRSRSRRARGRRAPLDGLLRHSRSARPLQRLPGTVMIIRSPVSIQCRSILPPSCLFMMPSTITVPKPS
jgi:hypothetical protein